MNFWTWAWIQPKNLSAKLVACQVPHASAADLKHHDLPHILTSYLLGPRLIFIGWLKMQLPAAFLCEGGLFASLAAWFACKPSPLSTAISSPSPFLASASISSWLLVPLGNCESGFASSPKAWDAEVGTLRGSSLVPLAWMLFEGCSRAYPSLTPSDAHVRLQLRC